jgi:hypothetical protein
MQKNRLLEKCKNTEKPQLFEFGLYVGRAKNMKKNIKKNNKIRTCTLTMAMFCVILYVGSIL